MGLRELILGSKPPAPVKCKPPDWPEPVWVRAWTGLEREEFQRAWRNWRIVRSMDDGDYRGFDAFMIRHVAQDEAGVLIFTDSDVEMLSKTSGRSLDYIVNIANRLNGFDAKDIEELVKNSGPSRSLPSGSGSESKTDAPLPM